MTSIIVALVFNAVDMVSGLLSAIKTGTIQSNKLRDGLFKKAGFILCYALAYLVDMYGAEVGFTLGFKVVPIIISYVVLTEVVSITENINVLNPDVVPEKILSMLNIKKD